MRGKPHGAKLIVSALGGILGAQWAFGQSSVQGVISAEERRIEQAQEAQDQIDAIVTTTRARFDEYQALLKEIENLEVYNGLFERQIEGQEQQLADLRTSIDEVTVIERQILPSMTRMITGLENFIALDVPFLLERRQARVAALKELVTRADVTTAEQFRNVLEAWQIEAIDYGSTVEAYTGVLEIDGMNREVDFLRIGRVAFLYLTPDARLAGAWDQRTRQWVPLRGDYIDAVREGLRIARGTDIPALFMIPVAPPEEG
jgi:hypothetical protein